MNGEKSKEHEIVVLKSIFEESAPFFNKMGYLGYVFENRLEDGIPDGIFRCNDSEIWIEHTQANLNYGEKASIMRDKTGFCIDMQRSLRKEGFTGCFCLDIPSSIIAEYFDSPEIRNEFLNIARNAVNNNTEYSNKERNINIKYCLPNSINPKILNRNKGLRIIVSQLDNCDFCPSINKEIYKKIIASKENKYKKNSNSRNENWLMIEIPEDYYYNNNDIFCKTDYFDKIFVVENQSFDQKELYIPRLVATK